MCWTARAVVEPRHEGRRRIPSSFAVVVAIRTLDAREGDPATRVELAEHTTEADANEHARRINAAIEWGPW